jgi:ribokinase
MPRTVEVFGPAYIDRVLRVDRPLIDPAIGPTLDQSVEGRSAGEVGDGRTLVLVDPRDSRIEIELPGGWPGPTGTIELSRPFPTTSSPWTRTVRGLSWRDDLGGMGAGFAAALGGELISALGPEDDPTSRSIEERLAAAGIPHRPIRVPDHAADWTLLITSGEFGDKLPIGFRGCHSAIKSLTSGASRSCDLRVVASLPNRLAAEALRAPGAAVRLFAPAIRNMVDSHPPLLQFADAVEVLCCNRREWESLANREEVAWRVTLLAITDGPAGSTVRFTTPQGEAGFVQVPAFPRSEPPRDTNRAGEAYAATLITVLLDTGRDPRTGVVSEDLVRSAATRAAAAAALVLDRLDFGFPTPAEVDAARKAGCVTPRTGQSSFSST